MDGIAVAAPVGAGVRDVQLTISSIAKVNRMDLIFMPHRQSFESDPISPPIIALPEVSTSQFPSK